MNQVDLKQILDAHKEWLYRARAEEFIHFFDAGLIPNPLETTEAA